MADQEFFDDLRFSYQVQIRCLLDSQHSSIAVCRDLLLWKQPVVSLILFALVSFSFLITSSAHASWFCLGVIGLVILACDAVVRYWAVTPAYMFDSAKLERTAENTSHLCLLAYLTKQRLVSWNRDFPVGFRLLLVLFLLVLCRVLYSSYLSFGLHILILLFFTLPPFAHHSILERTVVRLLSQCVQLSNEFVRSDAADDHADEHLLPSELPDVEPFDPHLLSASQRLEEEMMNALQPSPGTGRLGLDDLSQDSDSEHETTSDLIPGDFETEMRRRRSSDASFELL